MNQIPKLPLFASRRPRLSNATAYNWARGHGKVKLESFWIGQRIYTSLEALDRFIQANNPKPAPQSPPDQSGPSAPPPRDTSGPSAPPPPPSMLIQPSMERVVLLPEEVVERVQLDPEVEDEVVERVVLLPEPPVVSVPSRLVADEDPTLYPPERRERVPPPPAYEVVEVVKEVPADWMPWTSPRMVGAPRGQHNGCPRSRAMARRQFTREFKLSAVQLVNQQGYSVSAAARSLGVDRGCVQQWVGKLGAEADLAPSGDGAVRAELQRLRRENARLLTERDILKKLGRQS